MIESDEYRTESRERDYLHRVVSLIMSIFDEIMSIATEMREESTLSKRREAGRRLEQRLSSARVRQQLVTEGGRNGHHALAEVWRYIVSNSIAFVEKIAESKSKLTKADILIAFSIVKCCDLPEDSLSSHEAMIHGNFRLSRKEVKAVINFCLRLLNDDEAIGVAELDLLDMLAFLAGNRGYMAYLRSQNEIQVILVEVEKRIADGSLSQNVQQKAAIIFHDLCTCIGNLGLEMTSLVAGCVKMVSLWCRSPNLLNDSSSFALTSPLLAGLTIVLQNNVEQAVAALSRYGRAIFKHAKYRYQSVPDRGQRQVLNQYFICHL